MPMNELLDSVLRAHGGLDRWNTVNKVSTTIVAGGGLLPMKGIEVDPNPLSVTATTPGRMYSHPPHLGGPTGESAPDCARYDAEGRSTPDWRGRRHSGAMGARRAQAGSESRTTVLGW